MVGVGKLPTYPSPKPTFCPKWEVSVNVGLGEGKVGSFPETYNDSRWMKGRVWKEPHIATQLTKFCILLAEFTNLCFGGRLNF